MFLLLLFTQTSSSNFSVFKNFTPPHSKHRPPPLGINNEQSLKTVSALINIPFKTTQKGTGTAVKNNIFIK